MLKSNIWETTIGLYIKDTLNVRKTLYEFYYSTLSILLANFTNTSTINTISQTLQLLTLTKINYFTAGKASPMLFATTLS